MYFKIISGILIPFVGTVIGSAIVFLGKSKFKKEYENILSSFAGGVMLAASIWSLIIPALNYGEKAGRQLSLVCIGFILGIFTLIYADKESDSIYEKIKRGVSLKSKETLMQILAITIHNFPEGLAVGMIFASMNNETDKSVFSAAILLSLGIAIQNIPEGAIVSVPLLAAGERKSKAFFIGALSGIVEPIGAVIAILLSGALTSFMPLFMSFAAGAMIYVTMCQLAEPLCSKKGSAVSVIVFTSGFLLMMSLDVIFG